MAQSAILLFVAGLAAVAFALNDQDIMPTVDDIQRMMTRAAEVEPPAMGYGAKYMSGGAGEGSQLLEPDGHFQWRQQVKSDNALPAYCNPPNPCPYGFSPEVNGCMDVSQFENTAEFSKAYQEAQDCICDQEHMRNCQTDEPNRPAVDGPQDELRSVPSQEDSAAEEPLNEQVDDLTEALESYLAAHHEDKALPGQVAKKGGSDFVLNGGMEEGDEVIYRKKRSAPIYEGDDVMLNRVKKG